MMTAVAVAEKKEDDWVCNHTPKQKSVQFAELSEARSKSKQKLFLHLLSVNITKSLKYYKRK